MVTSIGIDTNVLVRYIVRDDEAEARLADGLFERLNRERPGFIGHVVLVELVWVLRRGYGYNKAWIVEVLERLLASADLYLEAPMLARLALADFRMGKADFADYLLAHRHQHEGCEVTVTFDRKAARHDFFRLLEPDSKQETV